MPTATAPVWGANDKISVASLAWGGRGTNRLNIYSRLPEARVVGLCDIDQGAVGPRARPKARIERSAVSDRSQIARRFERATFQTPSGYACEGATGNVRLRIHAVHKVRPPQFVSLALTAQTRLLAILRDWVAIGTLNVCTPIRKASSTIELVRHSDQELPLAKPTVGVTGRAIKVLPDMLSVTAACCYAILVVIAADNCYNIPGEDLRPTFFALMLTCAMIENISSAQACLYGKRRVKCPNGHVDAIKERPGDFSRPQPARLRRSIVLAGGLFAKETLASLCHLANISYRTGRKLTLVRSSTPN